MHAIISILFPIVVGYSAGNFRKQREWASPEPEQDQEQDLQPVREPSTGSPATL